MITRSETLSDLLLLLRFTVGYPSLAVAGFILGIVALGRMRMMTNGRRRLYPPLVSAAFGLSWTGLSGVIGIWQYGRFTVPLPFDISVISIAFSFGILWIGVSLASLAVIVLVQEFQHTGIFGDNRG